MISLTAPQPSAAPTVSGYCAADWRRAYPGPDMLCFDHDKLDAYRVGLDFVILADALVGTLPRGRAHLADQLHRAATSICLNIAEGAGEFSLADKIRFYRMAKRSAAECAAILDVLARLAAGEREQLLAGRALLLRVVSMLTKMSQRTTNIRHAES